MRRLFEKSIVRVYIESRVAWKVDKSIFEALRGQLASFWGQKMKIYALIFHKLDLTQFWPKVVSWRFETTNDELSTDIGSAEASITRCTKLFQSTRHDLWTQLFLTTFSYTFVCVFALMACSYVKTKAKNKHGAKKFCTFKKVNMEKCVSGKT